MSSLIIALGVTYMVLGTIGMTVNLAVCLLMGLSKKLKNPTYTYMVNHLVSDMFCLFPISIYTGFCMIIHEKYIERFMSVFVDLGWYPSGFFFMCIGATRIIAIGFKTRLEDILTRRVKIATIAAIWTPYTLVTVGYMFSNQKPAGLNVQVYTWWYNTDVPYGNYMNIYYAYHGTVTSIVIVAIDTLAIILIRRKLHSIHPDVRSTANRRREMKLLMQCLITSTFYSFTALVYSTMYESDWGTSLELQYYAIFHLIWIVNHSCSSIIYFLYNQHLIRTVKKFMFGGDSIQSKKTTTVLPIMKTRKNVK